MTRFHLFAFYCDDRKLISDIGKAEFDFKKQINIHLFLYRLLIMADRKDNLKPTFVEHSHGQ